MKRVFTLLILAVSILFFVSLGYANSIGGTYSQVIDDRSFGLTGDYQTSLTDRVGLEIDAQGQAGDIYKGRLQADLVIGVSTFDIKILTENKVKGYSLDSLGREQSIGLAASVPVENLNFDIGVGGKNASPFGVPNAFDTLVADGFSESDLEGKGLDAITAATRGIPFKNGNTVNLFVETGFTKGIFDIDVRGVLEILGEGSKMHQVNVDFNTSGKISGIVVTSGIEIGLASYLDAIYYETALVTSFGVDF